MDDEPGSRRRHRLARARRAEFARFGPLGLVAAASAGQFVFSSAGAYALTEGGAGEVGAGNAAFLSAETVALLMVLVILSAFFSACHAAFFSIHKIRIRQFAAEDRPSSRLIARLMEAPRRLGMSLFSLNLLVNIIIIAWFGFRLEKAIGEIAPIAPAFSFAAAALMSAGLLVCFGELLPKALGVRFRERFARAASFPVYACVAVVGPVYDGLSWIARISLWGTPLGDLRKEPTISDEEIDSALSDGEAHGVIDKDEREMIRGILKSTDAFLREILVPRPDVVALSEEATLEEALALYRDSGFSRMPVYRVDLDHITGVLFVKDLLSNVVRGNLQAPVKDVARPPMWVPETMTVQAFVKSAQRRRTHLAIVVDEHGGTEGLVTLEDAMEEVVGEIRDANESVEENYVRLPNGEFRVRGRLPLGELSELVGVLIESDEHETVAGFLMDETDKILEANDVIEHGGVLFVVESMDGKRVESLRISRVRSVPRKSKA